MVLFSNGGKVLYPGICTCYLVKEPRLNRMLKLVIDLYISPRLIVANPNSPTECEYIFHAALGI